MIPCYVHVCRRRHDLQLKCARIVHIGLCVTHYNCHRNDPTTQACLLSTQKQAEQQEVKYCTYTCRREQKCPDNIRQSITKQARIHLANTLFALRDYVEDGFNSTHLQ